MKIFNSIASFECAKKTVITLGTFDGVHLGHRKILERLVASTFTNDYESLVLTFFPHPRTVVSIDSDIKLLNTVEEKSELFEQLEVQNLVIHPFDAAFAQLSPDDFVKEVLVNRFKIGKIIIGHDHRFGKDRAANINDLIVFGKKYNFEVEEISAKEIEEISISSTKIRNALNHGNIALANSFLGYDYFLSGIVVHGKKLGRTIGFPTANLEITDKEKIIPCIGVYIIKTKINQNVFFGMINIGFNPTLLSEKLQLEVHLFDFSGNLYGYKLKVHFLHYMRPEITFSSVAALKMQLIQDKDTALGYINRWF